MLSSEQDRRFLRADPSLGNAGGRGRGRGWRDGGSASRGADLVALLARWAQAGKCTLSREKGREIGGSFLKTTRPKPRECPLAQPAEAQTGQPGPGSERGRAVPTRKEAGGRDSGTPRRCATSLSTCPFRRGASASEPRAEVARGHPKSDDAARPEQPGIAGD